MSRDETADENRPWILSHGRYVPGESLPEKISQLSKAVNEINGVETSPKQIGARSLLGIRRQSIDTRVIFFVQNCRRAGESSYPRI